MTATGGRIAIIGNGCAAAECVRALREGGHHGEIHLLSDTAWPPYNPMLTTYFVAGRIGLDGLLPYGSNEAFHGRYRVDLHLGSPVVDLDAERKVVRTEAGLEIEYGQCLVASGASAALPPVRGVGSARVFTMRTVEDAIRLRRAMEEGPRRAVVVGASMVGIKLVELFREAGMEVCLVEIAGHAFPGVAHPECARLIERRLADGGVRMRFACPIEAIDETPGGIRARLGRGEEFEDADLLVMCTGTRANIGFVDRTQVECRDGILVDEYMRASAPGLFAAGDVAQGMDLLSGGHRIAGLWASARYQGRTAGRNMVGATEKLPGHVPHNLVRFLGMDFVAIGDTRDYDRMETESDGRNLVQLFWREGILTGANLVGAPTEAGVIKSALLRGLARRGSGHPASLTAIRRDLELRRAGLSR